MQKEDRDDGAPREFEPKEIIGRGTWLDRVASEIVDRERKLGRDLSLIKVESGLGASGIPHIGSLGDAARAFGVKMALEEAGFKSELIAYSDDMDALRKVPAGLPSWLENEIGKPVSEIKDPEGCHKSYGDHMSNLLVEGLESLGLSYTFQSGYQAYKKGLLVKQIDLILRNSEIIGKKIEELTGQTKFQDTLPYFPQCENCGRLNVAHAYRYDAGEKKVYYKCSGDEIGRKWISGCGHEGTADITKGQGKLSWKVEFSARWAAFDIRYEAHGKELTDSVKINDWVSENILSFPAPYHEIYELFQDKSGKKISKSKGNLVTPQKWLELASPQSLLLLYFKRIVGARNLSEEDVPIYLGEYDELEDLYFGKTRDPNKMKEARLKGLYYYSNLKHAPERPSQHVPFNLLLELALAAPGEGAVDYVVKRLKDYHAIIEDDQDVRNRIKYALNWSKEFGMKQESAKVPPELRETIHEIAKNLDERKTWDAQAIQNMISEVSRTMNVKPSDLYKFLYLVLLGAERGPRLGTYIVDIGPDKIAKRLSSV